MSARVLILLNAFGCVVLAGLIVMQWRNERGLGRQLVAVERELGSAREQLDDEVSRRVALEQDLLLLKDSLAAAKAAVAERDEQLQARATDIGVLNERIAEAGRQLGEWQEAVRLRDARIDELAGLLQATRERLDEAVRKLKAVSNR